MSYITIEVDQATPIATITLNQPHKRNPLSFQTIRELTAAIETVGNSDTLGLILRANGQAFCAGHDFNDMLDQDLPHMRRLIQACSHLMQVLHIIPQPVVAQIQGAAIGAGCQLALSCDLVVAAEDAVFRTTGGASGWFCFTPMVALARAVGRKRALEMLLVGDPIRASQALEWGMINRAVPPAQLAGETLDLISRATQGSPLIRGMGKQAFYNQLDLAESQAYSYATELMAASGTMPHPQERIKAFVEKRPPVFN